MACCQEAERVPPAATRWWCCPGCVPADPKVAGLHHAWHGPRHHRRTQEFGWGLKARHSSSLMSTTSKAGALGVEREEGGTETRVKPQKRSQPLAHALSFCLVGSWLYPIGTTLVFQAQNHVR